MKIVIFICLFAFFSGGEGRRRTFRIYSRGTAFERKKEQAVKELDACIETFLDSQITSPMEDVCKNMKIANDCIRRVKDGFFGDDRPEGIEDAFKTLEKHYAEACEDNDLGGKRQSFRKKADICVDNLTSSLESSSTEDLCRNLRNTTDCIRSAVDDTFGEDEKAQGTLNRLEEFYNKNCKERAIKAENFEGKANACLHKYLNSSMDSSDFTEEMCGEMRKGIDCLRNAIDDVFGDDESAQRAQDALKELMLIKYYNAVCKESDIPHAENKCQADRGESCKKNLVTMMTNFDGHDGCILTAFKEHLCKSLKTTKGCFQSAVNNCLGDEKNAEIKRDLQSLEELMKDKECQDSGDEENDDDDDDVEGVRCLEENKGKVIYECMNEQRSKILAPEKVGMDKNTIVCSLYGMMTTCFVNRMHEQCGQKAAGNAKAELESLPREIAEACAAAQHHNMQTTNSFIPVSDHDVEKYTKLQKMHEIKPIDTKLRKMYDIKPINLQIV